MDARWHRTTRVLAVAVTAIACGCGGGADDQTGGPRQDLPAGVGLLPSEVGEAGAAAEPQGPTIEPGPSFAITATRLETSLISLRPGTSIPPAVLELIKSRSDALDPSTLGSLRGAGFLGAVLNDQALADLQRALSAPTEASGIVEGRAGQTDAAPLRDFSNLSVRPSAAWTMLVASSPRQDRWALSVQRGVAAFDPGSLRMGIRVWPEPGSPIPTAGMAARLRVQLLPVVVPLVDTAGGLDGGSTLERGLPSVLRGQMLTEQQVWLRLDAGGDARGTPRERAAGDALVLMALPRNTASATTGPEVDRPGLIGQVLLEDGPGSGPRLLVLRAVVPGTYRLLID